mgnify:CR=1 FL=1
MFNILIQRILIQQFQICFISGKVFYVSKLCRSVQFSIPCRSGYIPYRYDLVAHSESSVKLLIRFLKLNFTGCLYCAKINKIYYDRLNRCKILFYFRIGFTFWKIFLCWFLGSDCPSPLNVRFLAKNANNIMYCFVYSLNRTCSIQCVIIYDYSMIHAV